VNVKRPHRTGSTRRRLFAQRARLQRAIGILVEADRRHTITPAEAETLLALRHRLSHVNDQLARTAPGRTDDEIDPYDRVHSRRAKTAPSGLHIRSVVSGGLPTLGGSVRNVSPAANEGLA